MRIGQIISKINLPKIDITDNQKKIIIISLAALFVILLFWLFLYLPANREISKLRKELILTEQQIQGIEILLTGSQSRNEAIRLLKHKQQYLSNKFPRKEEESLRLIPEIARKMGINVISVQLGPKVELLDESGKQIIIENKVASYLPMTLELNCYYKDLVKYLLDLKASLPAFTSVNSLSIKKDDPLTGKLRVSVEFNLYLLN